MKAEGVIPDTTERVVAARIWRTIPGPTAGRRTLKSLGLDEVWPSGRPMKAACKKSKSWATLFAYTEPMPQHDAPGESCECGVWGLSDVALLASHIERADKTAPVVGVIEMWGRVVCAEDGWRGEYARVTALVARNPGHVRKAESQAAETYGVPILTDWPDLTPPLPVEMQVTKKDQPAPAKDATTRRRVLEIDDIPLTTSELTNVEGLPMSVALQVGSDSFSTAARIRRKAWTSEKGEEPSSSSPSTNLTNPSPNSFRRFLSSLSKPRSPLDGVTS